MNAIQRLKKRNNRVWAITTFPVFVFATIVVFPIAAIWNCVDVFFHLLFRSVREFFIDLYYDCKYDNKDAVYCIKWAWRDWYSIITTGKGLNDKLDDSEKQEKEV